MLEEQFELYFKVAKHFLDQLGLPFGWQLLVKVILFNDHVVISLEGLLDAINERYIQASRHIVLMIRQRIASLIQLLYPVIYLVCLIK